MRPFTAGRILIRYVFAVEMNFQSVLRLMPLLLLVPGSGCVTHALWEKASLEAWNEPAESPDLRLYHADREKDLLVVYDEYSERHDSVRTRAYLLYRNQERVHERQRPRFIKSDLKHPGAALPVLFSQAESPAADSGLALYAVASTNGPNFTIFSGFREVSSHELPVYNDGKGPLEKVALTPPAVIADATIIGGFVFLLAWSDGALSSVH